MLAGPKSTRVSIIRRPDLDLKTRFLEIVVQVTKIDASMVVRFSCWAWCPGTVAFHEVFFLESSSRKNVIPERWSRGVTVTREKAVIVLATLATWEGKRRGHTQLVVAYYVYTNILCESS